MVFTRKHTEIRLLKIMQYLRLISHHFKMVSKNHAHTKLINFF